MNDLLKPLSKNPNIKSASNSKKNHSFNFNYTPKNFTSFLNNKKEKNFTSFNDHFMLGKENKLNSFGKHRDPSASFNKGRGESNNFSRTNFNERKNISRKFLNTLSKNNRTNRSVMNSRKKNGISQRGMLEA